MSMVGSRVSEWRSAVTKGYNAALEVLAANPGVTDELNRVLLSASQAVQAGLTATDSSGSKVIDITVLNSRQTGIGVLDANNKPVIGAKVTFKDYGTKI